MPFPEGQEVRIKALPEPRLRERQRRHVLEGAGRRDIGLVVDVDASARRTI
jgi:hypothetical protein